MCFSTSKLRYSWKYCRHPCAQSDLTPLHPPFVRADLPRAKRLDLLFPWLWRVVELDHHSHPPDMGLASKLVRLDLGGLSMSLPRTRGNAHDSRRNHETSCHRIHSRSEHGWLLERSVFDSLFLGSAYPWPTWARLPTENLCTVPRKRRLILACKTLPKHSRAFDNLHDLAFCDPCTGSTMPYGPVHTPSRAAGHGTPASLLRKRITNIRRVGARMAPKTATCILRPNSAQGRGGRK